MKDSRQKKKILKKNAKYLGLLDLAEQARVHAGKPE